MRGAVRADTARPRDQSPGAPEEASFTALAVDPAALRSTLRAGSDVGEDIRETVDDLNNSGFGQAAFDSDLDLIETYLGYLKGNDLMQEYFDDYWASVQGEAWWPVAFDYTSPCSDSTYAVDYTSWPTVNVPVDVEAGDDQQQKLQDLKDGMDQSWNNGAAWAAGVAGQMRQICAQFTEPSASELRSAVELLQSRVVSRLDFGANDDWLRLGDAQSGWDGEFAYNFRVFYDNYNDVIERFGVFCGQINLGFALGARIIAAAQLGAGTFASSLKDYDATKAVVEDVDTLIGGGLLPEKKSYEEVMTGSEAYDLLSETLYDFYQDYRDGMDQLNAGGAGGGYEENAFSGSGLLANLNDVKGCGDVGLPDVPAANLN